MIEGQAVSKVMLLVYFFILYSCFAVLISLVLWVIGNYMRKSGEHVICKITRWMICLVLIPVIVFPLAGLYARFVEPNWIEVKHLTVKSPYFGAELAKLKIVQISDLHIEELGVRERSLVKIVNAQKPDLILITGDFVNSGRGLAPCAEVIRSFKKPRYGIIGVLGNHDTYFLREDDIISFLNNVGVEILRHGYAELDLDKGKRLWIVGLSDRYGGAVRYGDPSSLIDAFQGVPADEPKILLVHNPEVADSLNYISTKPQLVLAGHTHGGQFGIPFLRKFSWYAERSKYMNGLFIVNGVPLYVNCGIGVITRNIRFLARPEVTVIKLMNSVKR